MQIHNNTLMAECSTYDFKSMLRRKKVKSWLKSISAFANTDGDSLFYGVNDDGVIVGLENPQADADFISEMIKARLDPVPEVQLIPIEHEGHHQYVGHQHVLYKKQVNQVRSFLRFLRLNHKVV